MIKDIVDINHLIVSKILLKLVAISLVSFILFNTVFSSVILNTNLQDLSKISSIQKDVFSAIFFISNSIEKFNFSLTTKFIKVDNGNKQVPPQQQDKEIPSKNNIFISNNIQSGEYELNNVVNTNILFITLQPNNIFCNFNMRYLFMHYNYVYILMMLLFFILLNKLYEYNHNYKYILKNPLLFCSGFFIWR